MCLFPCLYYTYTHMRIKTGINTYGMTLTEAKNYLRVDLADDDTLINSFITASFEQVAYECNTSFLPATYSMSVYSSSGYLFLTSQDVNYVSTGSLSYNGSSWYTYLDTDFTGNITYYCNASGSYPTNVKVAQMILISSFYENRNPEVIGASVAPLSFSVNALLNPYKIIKSD